MHSVPVREGWSIWLEIGHRPVNLVKQPAAFGEARGIGLSHVENSASPVAAEIAVPSVIHNCRAAEYAVVQRGFQTVKVIASCVEFLTAAATTAAATTAARTTAGATTDTCDKSPSEIAKNGEV